MKKVDRTVFARQRPSTVYLTLVALVAVIGGVLSATGAAVGQQSSSGASAQTVAGTAASTDFAFASNGVSGRYRVYTEGVDFSQPVTVVVRLHGDGAYEYDNPGYRLDEFAAVARQHNAVLVAPQTPDHKTDTWWVNGSENSRWLADLVDAVILPEFGVDYGDIYWMGYSGGAEVLTRNMIPAHPDHVAGGALLLGGGGRPVGFPADAVARAAGIVGPLTWKTGTADNGTLPGQPWDAYGAVTTGAEFYRSNGFNTRAEFPVGVDHFGLEQAATLDQALAARG